MASDLQSPSNFAITRSDFLRRSAGAAVALTVLAAPGDPLAAEDFPVVREIRLASLEEAAAELSRVAAAAEVRAPGAWTPAHIFRHCAQSIDFAMRGFPEMRGFLFRNTAGRLARTVFLSRGYMSHNLNDPIPGAPALSNSDDTAAAIQELLASIRRFQAHDPAAAPLAPHFAYGPVDKPDYDRLQAMHIANHLSVMTY